MKFVLFHTHFLWPFPLPNVTTGMTDGYNATSSFQVQGLAIQVITYQVKSGLSVNSITSLIVNFLRKTSIPPQE